MKRLSKLEPIFDIIGEILAVFLVVIWILSLTNAQWGYLDGVHWLAKMVSIMRDYGSIILMIVVGLEAMCKRNLILFIIFLVAITIIIIFLFFPNTYTYLIGLIAKQK